MSVIVSYRKFFIWRLEYWVVFFESIKPEGRKHLKGGWYWRTQKKYWKPPVGSVFRCTESGKDFKFNGKNWEKID